MRLLGRNLKIRKNRIVLNRSVPSSASTPVPVAARDQVAQGALDEPEAVRAPLAGLGEEALQQLVDVQLVNGKLVFDEVADDGQHEAHERDGREEDVKGNGAGEERDVVFVRGFEGSPDDAGDRAVPAAFTIHARGSSSSSAAGGVTGGRAARARRRRAASRRRRNCSRVVIFASSSSSASPSSDSASTSASFNSPRTSSTLSSASSLRLRRPFETLRRVVSPPSVGANTNPATAPSTMPNKKAPNPPLRSLIRPPPRRPALTRAPPVAPHGSRASV